MLSMQLNYIKNHPNPTGCWGLTDRNSIYCQVLLKPGPSCLRAFIYQSVNVRPHLLGWDFSNNKSEALYLMNNLYFLKLTTMSTSIGVKAIACLEVWSLIISLRITILKEVLLFCVTCFLFLEKKGLSKNFEIQRTLAY